MPLGCPLYMLKYFSVPTWGLWGLPNQITEQNGLAFTFYIHSSANCTVTCEPSPLVWMTLPLWLKNGLLP